MEKTEAVQGLAQLLHIPIVGCDMISSAICMDKVATKEILQVNGIKTVAYRKHAQGQETLDFNRLSMDLGSPLFVKPARSGSSVGVSKVYTEEELVEALTLAHEHSSIALIEAGITAREIEVAIMGNPPYHQASVAGEIKPGEDFYTYEAKYADNSASQLVIPAEIGQESMQRIRKVALDAYELLGCRGLARVDFFLEEDGTLYLNEINTLPGFTNISMYPKLWRAEQVSYSDLVDRLIKLAFLETNDQVDQAD